MTLADKILQQLGMRNSRVSAGLICSSMGIKPNRHGNYSTRMRARYNAVGQELQRLKRAGKVKYIGGPGAGWRLA